MHQPPLRGVALAMARTAVASSASSAPRKHRARLVSLVAPLIAVGNRVGACRAKRILWLHRLLFGPRTSGRAAGVINIVTGSAIELAKALAAPQRRGRALGVRSPELSTLVEKLSVGNLKRTFVDYGRAIDWTNRSAAEGQAFLRRAVDVKNIWIPYGE